MCVLFPFQHCQHDPITTTEDPITTTTEHPTTTISPRPPPPQPKHHLSAFQVVAIVAICVLGLGFGLCATVVLIKRRSNSNWLEMNRANHEGRSNLGDCCVHFCTRSSRLRLLSQEDEEPGADEEQPSANAVAAAAAADLNQALATNNQGGRSSILKTPCTPYPNKRKTVSFTNPNFELVPLQ